MPIPLGAKHALRERKGKKREERSLEEVESSGILQQYLAALEEATTQLEQSSLEQKQEPRSEDKNDIQAQEGLKSLTTNDDSSSLEPDLTKKRKVSEEMIPGNCRQPKKLNYLDKHSKFFLPGGTKINRIPIRPQLKKHDYHQNVVFR